MTAIRYGSFLVSLGCCVVVGGCSDKTENTNHQVLRSEKQRITTPQIKSDKLDQQVAGNSDFAFDLYQKLKGEQKGNLLFSPHSISTAFAMVHGGARGETEKQIAATMHFDLEQVDLHGAFNKLDLELESRGKGNKASDGGDFRLNVVNALWGQVDHPFRSDFLDLLAINYGAGMHLLDFIHNPEGGRAEINKWVEDQTEERIKDLLPKGSISEGTRLVLTNAVYFNAAWKDPFPATRTAPAPFAADAGEVEVQMMSADLTAGYVKTNDYEAVELPYDGGELSMLVILPERGKLDDLQKKLSSATINEVLDGLSPIGVDLSMPKFEFESDFSLAEQLKALGMILPFSIDMADFTAIDDGVGQLYISKVMHKAFVKVSEEGTEAAAATAIVMDAGASAAPPERVRMVVDHPFLFLIRDRITGAVLFVGRVMDPSAK